MEPKTKRICEYLDSQKIIHTLGVNEFELITEHQIGTYHIEIRAQIPKNFPCSLPIFQLINREKFGGLAHVGWGEFNDAEICYGRDNNLSTDIYSPGKVYYEALSRALSILNKSLNDRKYNECELLREFAGVWRCHIPIKSKQLICIVEPSNKPLLLYIRSPKKDAGEFFGKKIYAIDSSSPCNDKNFFTRDSQDKGRSIQGKGVTIPISPLILPPAPDENIGTWWKKQLSALSDKKKKELKKLLKKTNTKDFYILCHGEYKEDTIWFGIYCQSSTKQYAPITLGTFDSWDFQAIHIDVISQDLLVPRGGGNSDLGEAKVCIVGCGSVGGYVADMLASSGVGYLTLIDNDLFKIENLHRNVLNPIYLFWRKVDALKHQLEHKYPFVGITPINKELSEITDPEFWEEFNAVIVAIGAASHERQFNEIIKDQNINTPVITTWVEPFGVGGHAVASIPGKRGCLACAYIDNESDLPDLYPNLSFIERNQYVLESLGGCGTEFMAFSSIDAMQTATIASKLCIKSIKEDMPQGRAVSWKSDSVKANEKGISFTHRYVKMTSNLKDIEIARDSCPLCSNL